jgi:dTDP-4-amino-4,6-dideoxygalactose transaminase
LNSRLDELQAALLRIKLSELPEVNRRRRAVLDRYRAELGQIIRFVATDTFGRGVAHLAVVRHPDRDAFRQRLSEVGIGTLVHYPVCGHLQPAFRELGYERGDFPVAERACAEVLSLPCYYELTDAEQAQVIAAVKQASAIAAAAA